MKNEDYLILKFGRIKGGCFENNPTAFKMFDDGKTDIDVIKEFTGSFYDWWNSCYITKKDAINYILNYGK